MTFADLKKAAYHGRPIPDGLSETERLQYIAARRIYAGYKSGEIDRTEAEPMLGKVQEIAGKGLCAEIRGVPVCVGNANLMEMLGISFEPEKQCTTPFGLVSLSISRVSP